MLPILRYFHLQVRGLALIEADVIMTESYANKDIAMKYLCLQRPEEPRELLMSSANVEPYPTANLLIPNSPPNDKKLRLSQAPNLNSINPKHKVLRAAL